MTKSKLDGAIRDRDGGESFPLKPIPPHLNVIVAALLSGATDVAASHQLNCSPRTFSRRVGELLEYLGVETRFQAGVKLAMPESGPLDR
ncbi:hypothetical protein V6U77_04845 [Micromonospora sp. CPCC 205546]|uniref:helix-turn-helix transcriptional regulator n=1 Tax=Micromonospora TaxID=1873 RepID=UPI000B5AEE4B|nr:hypothetical protein [Micromonospora echinofusca]